jgi:hypothetical protein
MRFATRYDRWLVALLVLAGSASCVVLPWVRFYAPSDHPGPPWMAFIAWPIWILALAATLPQYYELRDDALFIRQGWRRILAPYGALLEVQSVTSAMSAAVFSTQRLLVVSNDGRQILIAVADEDRFMSELARRAPQLERKAFGLGVSMAPHTIL